MRRLFILTLIFGAGCQGSHVVESTKHAPVQTGFVQRQVMMDGVAHPVWVFIPTNYNPDAIYPTILFLHGLFEQGNGGTNVLSGGLAPVIARNPDHWPFITIFPQSSGDWKGEACQRLAMASLKEVERHLQVDPDRVILAGLSFGGQGVWEIGAKNPERFAALVSISGLADAPLVDKLTATPVWAFASQDDPFVSVDNSIQMCREIESHGGRAKLTQFPGNEHDCWTQAVEQSELVDWMLGQARDPLRTAALSTAGTSGHVQASGRLRSWNDR